MSFEVTVKIKDDKANAFKILNKLGWKLEKHWVQTSTYWTHLDTLNVVPYRELIENSVLVRDMKGRSENCVEFMYKDKSFDKNGNVVNEQKIVCSVGEEANEILRRAGFKNWVIMKAEQNIFEKDSKSFCIQDVDGLGLFLEVEEDRGVVDDLIDFAKSLGLELGNDFVGIKLPYMLYLKNQEIK